MGKNDDLFDATPVEHNHPLCYWPLYLLNPDGLGVRPQGECPKCDSWRRFHEGNRAKAPAAVVEEAAIKRRGRPKKEEAPVK